MASRVDDGHAATGQDLARPDSRVPAPVGETYGRGQISPAEAETQFQPASTSKLAHVPAQLILERVAAGELLREIAAEYGCTQPAVSHHIRKHVPSDVWADVRQLSIAARLEKSAQDMETADDVLMLARARESARLWMWRAERELPHLYGQRQQITHEVGINLGEILDAASRRVASAQRNAPKLPDAQRVIEHEKD